MLEGFSPVTAGSRIVNDLQFLAYSIFYGIGEIIDPRKEESVRTTIDIPVSLYCWHQRCSSGEARASRSLLLRGPKVEVTNARIYEQVEFP
jgi:hypothetical protein